MIIIYFLKYIDISLNYINIIGDEFMTLNGKYYGFKKKDGNGYNIDLQKCIEETFQYCLDNINAGLAKKISKPIMMLGKIQSGKTRAFTGLIALAFDNDFDMIFILTKNSEALVEQTVSRMKKEFYFERNSVIVRDIMKASSKISGYELQQKNIFVAKKQSKNLDKLIEFIQKYSINTNKKCLIIDDEADTTGIGYEKVKGSDEFTLRTVSSKVNEIRGALNRCVFIEVTATPYALYLQPDFDENAPIKPIKPVKTVLVPYGSDYIGGEYYFLKSNDENDAASLIFEPMTQEECDLVSDQKNNGKKSKIEDRRSFKLEEIITNKNRLYTFKKGIINFIIGSITLRTIYNNDKRFAYVIHTARQKNSHFNLENIAEYFLSQIKERTPEIEIIIQSLLTDCYSDIKSSIEKYSLQMPLFDFIKTEFFNYIDNEFYSIDVVNSDNDISSLLNAESGELTLRTPCSIFIGGQVLDRGVTIHNMIGFYYGRNPVTMQQDTVLQHSRMFGYRKHLLPVTRFYTTNRIYSNMKKITEIDEMLRSDIAKGKQGEGVYFITNQQQNKQHGKGGIRPCSPEKIKVSDIILLKSHQRLLPIGFSPVVKSTYQAANNAIENLLQNEPKIDDFTYEITIEKVQKLIELVYSTIEKDDISANFISKNEMSILLEYFANNCETVFIQVYKNMNLSKYKKDGVKLQDSPDTSSVHLSRARQKATTTPVLMLFQENGNDPSWNNRPFWWPVLVAPKNIPNVIYASKVTDKKIIQD